MALRASVHVRANLTGLDRRAERHRKPGGFTARCARIACWLGEAASGGIFKSKAPSQEAPPHVPDSNPHDSGRAAQLSAFHCC